ncbi:unnamed protein product [Lathyrus sativus]|nr:unnamed protein product [Lathyrus sativus]
MPGRPKKKKNKEVGEQARNETQLKREKFGIKYSRCHKDGCNKATCELPTTVVTLTLETPIQPQPAATSSQPTLDGASTQQPPKKKRKLQKGLKPVQSQP